MGLQTTSIPYRHSSYPYYYLCNYLPVSAGRDTLSHSLLKFKLGLQPDLEGWIDCALGLLAPVPFPEETIIIRALHHDETMVPDCSLVPAAQHQPASLDILAQALAGRFSCRYLPSLLRKSRLTRQSKGLSREHRQTELNDVYTLLPPTGSPTPHPPFLIIDDILTTGTTIRMIIRAILSRYPHSPIRAFTLARADHDPTLNHSTPLRGQNYHLEQGAGWRVSEEETGYYSGENLRKWILANTF